MSQFMWWTFVVIVSLKIVVRIVLLAFHKYPRTETMHAGHDAFLLAVHVVLIIGLILARGGLQ